MACQANSTASAARRWGKLPTANEAPGESELSSAIPTGYHHRAVPSEPNLRELYHRKEWTQVVHFGVTRQATGVENTPSARVFLWLARASWLVVALCAPWWSLSDGRSVAVATALQAWGWGVWLIVGASLLVPTPASLTAIRITVPIIVAQSIAVIWHGDPTQNAFLQAFAVAGAVVTWRLSYNPIVVDDMVQGGAYGQEIRFALRTPWPHVLPAIVAWLIFVGSLTIGTLLLAAQQWIAGVLLTAIGVALVRTVPKRIHRLSRRWLVLVPAGIVIHDHMVLAETMMLRRHNITFLNLVDVAGEEADLTGGVLGSRLVVGARNADKVILTPIAARLLKTGEALHVQSFAIAPRRRDAAYAAMNMPSMR